MGKRHLGIFFLLMAAAAVIALNTPTNVAPRMIFLYALVVFLVYLGISFFFVPKRKG